MLALGLNWRCHLVFRQIFWDIVELIAHLLTTCAGYLLDNANLMFLATGQFCHYSWIVLDSHLQLALVFDFLSQKKCYYSIK